MKLDLKEISIINDRKIEWQKFGLLSGYVFFVLMIFAKARGLDSSNKSYYIFAAVAAVFWVVESLFYKFSKKQFIVSVIMMLIALATVVSVHKPGFILTMMAVVALRNMDRERLLKLYFFTWVVGLAAVAILVSTGIVEDITNIDYRGHFRHGAGFCTGNCYHSAFTILFGLYFYYRRGKSKWWEVLLAECINGAVFYFSGSYTGVAVGFLIPILMYLIGISSAYYKLEKNHKVVSAYLFLLCLLMVIVVGVSIIWPAMIKEDPFVTDFWYSSFTGRLWGGYKAFENYQIKAFGNRISYLMLDNAYMYILFQFGVIPFILVIAMYATAIASLVKKKDVYALTLIAIFVAYGFMEQFFNAAFMNFTWIIVGCEVMNEVVPKIGNKVND